MRSIKIMLFFLLGSACSAYQQLHKPSTLPQYHRKIVVSTNDNVNVAWCGTSINTTGFTSEEISRGKKLFKNNCAQCHNKNMKDDLTGPALAGVQKRWEGRESLLKDWIRNSQTVIDSGDEYANAIYQKWGKTEMNPFPHLTDEDIDVLLAFIEQ